MVNDNDMNCLAGDFRAIRRNLIVASSIITLFVLSDATVTSIFGIKISEEWFITTMILILTYESIRYYLSISLKRNWIADTTSNEFHQKATDLFGNKVPTDKEAQNKINRKWCGVHFDFRNRKVIIRNSEKGNKNSYKSYNYKAPGFLNNIRFTLNLLIKLIFTISWFEYFFPALACLTGFIFSIVYFIF